MLHSQSFADSRPTYMCSILTADSGTNSADICKELTTASAESLNIVRKFSVLSFCIVKTAETLSL